mmetsp:Transcript_19738/g.56619  ORF Transcript_19738/g.56619 Transcript_19738/m.56619 type:complete len:287 (+) Transcript_19738:614-1474(+)
MTALERPKTPIRPKTARSHGSPSNSRALFFPRAAVLAIVAHVLHTLGLRLLLVRLVGDGGLSGLGGALDAVGEHPPGVVSLPLLKLLDASFDCCLGFVAHLLSQLLQLAVVCICPCDCIELLLLLSRADGIAEPEVDSLGLRWRGVLDDGHRQAGLANQPVDRHILEYLEHVFGADRAGGHDGDALLDGDLGEAHPVAPHQLVLLHLAILEHLAGPAGVHQYAEALLQHQPRVGASAVHCTHHLENLLVAGEVEVEMRSEPSKEDVLFSVEPLDEQWHLQPPQRVV